MAIINKKLIHFNSIATFNNCQVAANASNDSWLNAGTNASEALDSSKNQIKYLSIVYIKDEQKVWTHGQIYTSKEYEEYTGNTEPQENSHSVVTEHGLRTYLRGNANNTFDTALYNAFQKTDVHFITWNDPDSYPPINYQLENTDAGGFKFALVYSLYNGTRDLNPTANNLVTEGGLRQLLNTESSIDIANGIYNNLNVRPVIEIDDSNVSFPVGPMRPTKEIDEKTGKAIHKIHYLIYPGATTEWAGESARDLDLNNVGIITESALKDYLQSNYALATTEKQGLLSATDKATIDSLSTNYAQLDSTGKVLTSQLPSFVDDVLEFASTALFPATGEGSKIYVATNTNLTYRWTGSQYVEISKSLALGTTSSTAYRGDLGNSLNTRMGSAETKLNNMGTTISNMIITNEEDKKLVITIPESWFSNNTSGILNITTYKAPAQKYILNNNYDLYIRRGTNTPIKANVIYREGDIIDGNPKYSIFDCVFLSNSVQHSIIVEVQYTTSFTIKAEMEGKTILDRLNELDGGTALYPVSDSLKGKVINNRQNITALNNTVSTHTTEIANVTADAPQPLKLYLAPASGTNPANITVIEQPDDAHIQSGNFEVFVTYLSNRSIYEKAVFNREVSPNGGQFYRRYRANYFRRIYEILVMITSNGLSVTSTAPVVGYNGDSDPQYPLDSAVINFPAYTSWPLGEANAATTTSLYYGEVKNIITGFVATINGSNPRKPQLLKVEDTTTCCQYTFRFWYAQYSYYMIIDMAYDLTSFSCKYYRP